MVRAEKRSSRNNGIDEYNLGGSISIKKPVDAFHWAFCLSDTSGKRKE
ncbi:hypothetical protein HQN90_06185 [Paenibacillus alba]|nr:hypothetical protein [Paenibacillus alba]NQX65710.1 hypothetical protein [Paenibacillus alba]